MAYLIIRTDGKWVARAGSQHSYTTKIENARVFDTRAAAEADRCVGNEHVVEVIDALRSGRW